MISCFIKGIPFPAPTNRHRATGLAEWKKAIIKTTENLPMIQPPWLFHVTFILFKDNCPPDCPHGADLDNLLKPLLDALNKTVLKKTKRTGLDSNIISISAQKTFAKSPDNCGAQITIISCPPTS